MALPTEINPFVKTCPLCGTSSHAFACEPRDDDSKRRLRNLKLPGGDPGRNETCPACGSNSTERLLYLYLLHYTEVFNPTARRLRVLALCELPRLTEAIGNVSRIELAHEFSATMFDVVVEDSMLERADDDRKTLALLRDQLSPGGLLVLSEAVSPVLPATLEDAGIETERQRRRAYGSPARKRVFGADFGERITAAGLVFESFDRRTDRGRFGGWRNRFALAAGRTLTICRREADAYEPLS